MTHDQAVDALMKAAELPPQERRAEYVRILDETAFAAADLILRAQQAAGEYLEGR